jgi:SagB-type dehydrogenase family enzyme
VNRKDNMPVGTEYESARALPAIRNRTANERSTTPCLPDLLQKVHRATLIDEFVRPTASHALLSNVGNPNRKLCWSFPNDMYSVFERRESSAGRLRREPPLELAALEQILQFATNSTQYKADLYGCHVALPSVRLSIIARNVQGLQAGAYDYCVSTARLLAQGIGRAEEFQQSAYFLPNYNLNQMAALLVVIGRFEVVLSSFGARGIRVLNAEAGMLTQRVYLASSALSLGCGVVAGFDAQQINRVAGVDGKVEIPLLLVFLGHQPRSALAYDFRLY